MGGSVIARVSDGTRLLVDVVSDQGATLSLVGDLADVTPTVVSGEALAGNPALLSNAWAFAKARYDMLMLPDALQQKQAEKRAEYFRRTAQWIADVADDLSPYMPKQEWCSACFAKTEHRKSNRPAGQLPVYVCQGCGSPTLPCAGPGCSKMAVRERGAIRVPQFCAEHRHDIPGFEKATQTMEDLHEYEEFLAYDQPDLGMATKITAVGVVGLTAAAPLALLAAPAIGGALGSLGIFGGLSGAAASAHGLALLGGGALAAGGLGMAGGTAVVTVVGAAVGGALGASVSNAYLREDKSFRIELLKPGNGGVPVVVANGFLTAGDHERWGGWKQIVSDRYPDSPVYRVRWGAKELKDLAILGAGGASKGMAGTLARGAAAHATKAGAKIFGRTVVPAMIGADLAANPWHVAKNRADKTGVVLADLIARTREKTYVLIGHSLGGRVMAVAAETLGTRPGSPRIQAAHILGGAMRAKGDWSTLGAGVEDAVYCYHSANDPVLKYVYPTAQGGQSAAGLRGFTPVTSRVKNVDVSHQVSGHSEYFTKVQLA